MRAGLDTKSGCPFADKKQACPSEAAPPPCSFRESSELAHTTRPSEAPTYVFRIVRLQVLRAVPGGSPVPPPHPSSPRVTVAVPPPTLLVRPGTDTAAGAPSAANGAVTARIWSAILVERAVAIRFVEVVRLGLLSAAVHVKLGVREGGGGAFGVKYAVDLENLVSVLLYAFRCRAGGSI